MYREARIDDLDKILKLTDTSLSKEEIEQVLKSAEKYIYVFENENADIIGASVFGADSIDEDAYDSEIYGLYTRNSGDSEIIKSELLFETKRELFEKGYRNLIIWCDDTDEKNKKFYRLSGGIESKKREVNDKIEIAFTYELIDYPDLDS